MRLVATLCALLAVPLLESAEPDTASRPLAEHPRPDFERPLWKNLNGSWPLRFDPQDVGEKERWFAGTLREFDRDILVPFPWGSKLSGVPDLANIAWYAKALLIPPEWKGKRVFLCVGASDWHTSAWLNGELVGRHWGGYTPFEFELTDSLSGDGADRLMLRIDDAPRAFKLEGKQGYGNARGIWQTVWLEARPPVFLRSIHFSPDLKTGSVEVRTRLSGPAPFELPLALRFRTGGVSAATHRIAQGQEEATFSVPIPTPRLWSLDDPFLYEVEASLAQGGEIRDTVSTYFGMRSVGVTKLPGTDFPWVALNGKPLYLQIALDQAYHPDGFYTWPSDEFVREEILLARRIGLNAIRIHVKIDSPRKLYWADKLGLLVMADVPNSWGEPNEAMRGDTEAALRGMVERDFNHPSIFSWVVFNETWGLFSSKSKDLTSKSKDRAYLPETQEWVRSMYKLAKELDPTRLVEDNSPCNFDHVETDLNTWHAYLPGWAWKEHLDQICKDTFAGSAWNYAKGHAQDLDPLINSECGNVWGYEGSTGDVDWSWDYHIMMNEFRRHPRVGGWLYTEFHDVINEWNGYYRFDRSEKETGLGAIVPGMTLLDFHAPFYVATGGDLCRAAKPGDTVEVPLWASFLADRAPSSTLFVRAELRTMNGLGAESVKPIGVQAVPFTPWMSREIAPLTVELPQSRCVAVVALNLEDSAGAVLQRNFTTFVVGDGPSPRDEVIEVAGKKARALRLDPKSHARAEWSKGTWSVLDGLKVCGAGSGLFEYRVAWPADLDPAKVSGASFRLEASAKQLFTKDRKDAGLVEGNFMLGKGTLDPALNPNAYPMTDTVKFPTSVRLVVNGREAGRGELPDDPADHRGILSWHAQLRDKKLRDAGSYGYLTTWSIPAEALQEAARSKQLVLRLEVDAAQPGGLAIYGERFGRYPLDPTVLLEMKE